MPKRKRSASEHSGQIKTFVNTKVMGEKSSYCEEVMSRVYEKTKRLLWLGSRSALDNPPVQSRTTMHPSRVFSDRNQLRISNAGHLVKSNECSEGACQADEGQICSTCREELNSNPSTCSWCSSKICSCCFRTCHVCLSSFCHLCSILDYQMSDERTLCFQCKS